MRPPTRWTLVRYKVWLWRQAVLLGWLEVLEWWEEIRAVQAQKRIADELSRNPMGYGRKPFATTMPSGDWQ